MYLPVNHPSLMKWHVKQLQTATTKPQQQTQRCNGVHTSSPASHRLADTAVVAIIIIVLLVISFI